MAKTFFKLTGAYDGLQARRLRWSGRLGLFQVFNDGPGPYWLIQIQNFNPVKDVAAGLIDPFKNNTWRFVDLESAYRKYEQLTPLFPPRKYTVPPPASAARMAELRAIRQKSLRNSEQGTDLVSTIRKAMEAACN